MSKKIRIYETRNGKAPFKEWAKNLKDRTAVSKIKARLDRLEVGHYGDYKALGGNLFELRIAFGPGYRLYFSEHEDVLLLLGGDKGSQRSDITKAKAYLSDFLEREHE